MNAQARDSLPGDEMRSEEGGPPHQSSIRTTLNPMHVICLTMHVGAPPPFMPSATCKILPESEAPVIFKTNTPIFHPICIEVNVGIISRYD